MPSSVNKRVLVPVLRFPELRDKGEADQLFTYNFNILRSILEKTATFHGFPNFSACIKQDNDDEDGILHARLINVLSHGKGGEREIIWRNRR